MWEMMKKRQPVQIHIGVQNIQPIGGFYFWQEIQNVPMQQKIQPDGIFFHPEVKGDNAQENLASLYCTILF